MSDDYKKYDSDDKYANWSARLTDDAKVVKEAEGDRAPMVKITFVSTSRNEQDSDLWVTCVVQDRQAELARCLKKGDVIGVEGKPSFRKYKANDGTDRTSFDLRRAELHVPIALFSALKERGFTPGAKGAAPAKKPAAAPPKKATRPVVDLDD